MYRTINNLVDILKDHIISAGHSGTRGHSEKLLIPSTRTKVMQQSLFPDGIRLWNKLSQAAVDFRTLESFKSEAHLNAN